MTEPAASPVLDCDVLLGVRLVGFGPSDAVARRTRHDADVVDEALRRLEQEQLVTGRWDAFPGWSLTTDGRRRGEELLAAELAERGAIAAVRAAYDGFLALNHRFLHLCTSWQLKSLPGNRFEPNAHDDPQYDLAVLERLGAIDAEIAPVLDGLARELDRFDGYRDRLSHARSRIESGDGDWFTRPVIDSYHTVWFELHEHLLATLGLERNAEPGH